MIADGVSTLVLWIREESDTVVERSQSSPISIDRHWRQRFFRGEIGNCGIAEVLEPGAEQ